MRSFALALPIICANLTVSWAYDVAFLAHPRTEGNFPTQSVSELRGPYVAHAATQLIISDEDGNERILVDGNVLDFSVSLDGKSILFTKVVAPPGADPYSVNPATRAEVFRYILDTDKVTQLTDGPITSGPSWNCQPVETADGIAFLSSRDGWKNPHEDYRAFTIYKMNLDGSDEHRIWHAGLGGVFGLSTGPNGRIYFSSGENQGFRGGRGNSWSIWSVNPDGSDFNTEFTAILHGNVSDWPVISSSGAMVFARYYDLRGYGTIYVSPKFEATPFGPPTMFESPIAKNNGGIRDKVFNWNNPFSWNRRGTYNLVPGSEFDYENSKLIDGVTVQYGMYSHPAAIPDNGIYLTWTGDKGDAQMDLGVYAIADVATVVDENSQLVKVVDLPTRHEWMARPVIPFAAIYGTEPPTPTATVTSLPVGSPYGVIGTSAVDVNEWVQGGGDGEQSRVTMQPDEAEFVRVLAFTPTLDARVPDVGRIVNGDSIYTVEAGTYEGFVSEINERVGFYEQLIPIKKWLTSDGSLFLGPNPPAGSIRVTRQDGRPDTSWCAEVPANQPWSLQLLDSKKQAISGSTAQTWHQVNSREQRTNCQGCHAHWNPDQIPFEATLAASRDFPRPRLSRVSTVVYERDIEPLGLNIPQRPWKQGYRTYESGTQSLDDDPSFTPAEAELIRAWQDTGFMAAGAYTDGRTIQPEDGIGPYADTMDPTLIVSAAPEGVVVGACDPQSDIDRSSFQITLNGRDITNRFLESEPLLWIGAAPLDGRDEIVFSIADNAGNVTRVKKGQSRYRPQRPIYRPPTPR